MNAIKLLKEQHAKVQKLFGEIRGTESADEKKRLADELADLLSVHATIEERHFYPRVMTHDTQERLREAVEEHLGSKRLVGDLMQCDPRDPQYMAKVVVLDKEITRHVFEEEGVLFKRAESLLASSELEDLGNAMMWTAQELRSHGAPRDLIPFETSAPAPLPPIAPEEGAGKVKAAPR
jgi:hemerythrin superfamily protein